MRVLSDVIKEMVGEQIAVIAARYQYRGVLHEVGDDYLTLSNATSVEVSGTASGERPTTEDAIGGSVHICLGAVEIVYQPRWSEAPLPGHREFANA